MKKVIAIILCIGLVFSFAACGGGTDSSSDNISANTDQTQDNNQPEGNTSAEANEPGNTNGAIEALEKRFTALENDNIKWDYNSSTKTIVISGKGPMKDYAENEPEWYKYCIMT